MSVYQGKNSKMIEEILKAKAEIIQLQKTISLIKKRMNLQEVATTSDMLRYIDKFEQDNLILRNENIVLKQSNTRLESGP